MEPNKYAYVGWLAVAQAIIFPLGLVIGIVEQGIASGLLGIDRPVFGPSDIIMIISTVISVYILLKFKSLLNEQYQYHDLDLLIYVSVAWLILFETVGLGLGLIAMIMWPVDKVIFAIVFLVFFAAAMVSVGIIDIIIAVKILKIREQFGEYIRAFGYVSMAAGICEVSVLLSPLSLPLVPVTSIILALIFFKDRPQVDFV